MVVEVPRLSFVKRGPTGAIDFLSPLPCPFNYGSVPGTLAEDGDPLDAILLGRRRARGQRVSGRVLGVVGFLDAGVPDPKLVLGERLRLRDRLQLEAFFRVYALAKGLSGRRPTRCEGLTALRDFAHFESLLA